MVEWIDSERLDAVLFNEFLILENSSKKGKYVKGFVSPLWLLWGNLLVYMECYHYESELSVKELIYLSIMQGVHFAIGMAQSLKILLNHSFGPTSSANL